MGDDVKASIRLQDIQDVGITSPNKGDVVTFNGKAFINQPQYSSLPYSIDSGTVNNYKINPAPPISSLYNGLTLRWMTSNANTAGVSTLNVSGLGPTPCTWNGSTALPAGIIQPNVLITTVFDGTYWEIKAATTTNVQGTYHVVNVTDAQWGAVGDGQTDDTAAIQSAINYAGSLAFSLSNLNGTGVYGFGRSYVTVYLPSGLYYITSQLVIPAGVNLHTEGIFQAQMQTVTISNGVKTVTQDPYTPAIKFNTGSHASLLQLNSYNNGSGVVFGEVGQHNDCKIGTVRLWNIGNAYSSTLGPQRGIVFQGYDYQFDSLEVDGGNIGIDFNQCSDIRGNKIISVLAATGVRITSGTEHLYLDKVDIDTPQYLGLQIDSSDDIWIETGIFINDKNNTGPIATAILIGEYSGASNPVSFMILKARVSNTGGSAMSLANCRDSTIELIASLAPLGTGNAKNLTNAITYGTKLDDSVLIKASIDPGIASPISGTPFGTLLSTVQNNFLAPTTVPNSASGTLQALPRSQADALYVPLTDLPVSVANGGTGATTAATALSNLGGITETQANALYPSLTGSLSTDSPVSGTVYQNTTGQPITVLMPVTYNPTSSAAATMTPALGSSSPPGSLPAESEPASLTVGRVRSYCLRVPAGWYYSFTTVNATLGTAQIIQG